MDFFDLDTMVPVYVDYLGSFERNVNGIETAPDAMKELVDYGVQDRRFLPAAEMSFTRDKLIIRSTPERAVFENLDLIRISEPVAFIRKGTKVDGFSRVVIFTEEQAGHFKSNDLFHAVQCCDGDPAELVELITKLTFQARNNNKHPTRKNSDKSQGSLDFNWFHNPNPTRKNGGSSETDSIRSATISKRNYGQSRASLVFGAEPASAVPVKAPTPPTRTPPPPRPRRGDNPQPLIVDPIKTAETLGFERPSFLYARSEDPVQKDTILLNYCIADIERFRNEIERCKAGLAQHDFQATDFFGIFQKFKLAFNLLARLNGFIDNPSAGTILHHLFPSLAFLVDECYDLFDEDLVREVVTPLPTVKAIDMMQKGLTQPELAIWRALGNYWLNPRSEWEGDIAPYSPRFHDGWSPGIITFQDDQPEFGADNNEDFVLNKMSQHDSRSPTMNGNGFNDDARSFRGSVSSVSVNVIQDTFRDELLEKNATIALVMFPRNAQNDRELSLMKGEYLEILESNKKWWRAVNFAGQVGYVPCTILKKLKLEDPVDDDEAEKKRSRAERKPSNLKKEKKKPRRRSTSSESSSGEKTATPPRSQSSSNAPKPPPPPPPPPQPAPYKPSAETKSNHKRQPDTVRSVTSVQEELKSVLEIFNKREKHLDIIKTPEVFITASSSPKEVQKWLKEKQFSKRAHDELFAFDGRKLFAMSRQDLISAFGKSEGTRLFSQITISRNTQGYTTGKSSELRKVLERHRSRIEKDPESGDETDSDGVIEEEQVEEKKAAQRQHSRA